MAAVTLKGIGKRFGEVEVLRGIDLEIEEGEFVVFVGPSGCGKSTLLRLIAGLEEITEGNLLIGDQLMNEVPAAQRGIAMVFQSYALYPHMTVRDNMAFALEIAKRPRGEIEAAVTKAAEILQLTPLLDRLPKALSGGQRQRVAIGRAIVRDPRVFLFDEPLSNLDAALRVATRIEIAQLKEKLPQTTMVYVTHDQVEAMTLADRIVVLNAGRIEQVGAPLELYQRPANLFVARFIGSPAMNLLPAKVLSGRPISGLPVTEADGFHIGVRPEDLSITEAQDAALLQGRVSTVEALGETTLIYLQVADLPEPLIVKLPGSPAIPRGEVLGVTAAQDRLHLFDSDGRALRPGDEA